MSRGLFDEPCSPREVLGEGAVLLRGFVRDREKELIKLATEVAGHTQFRHPTTPSGIPMSVEITNCGELGWYSDSRGGYRYVERDPKTGLNWPAMPSLFKEVAIQCACAAGYPDFTPEAGLINRYAPGAKLSLHRDEDEQDLAAPIISISLGVRASFLWGGLERSDRLRRIELLSGDVVVWGGPSRLVYHGIEPLGRDYHPLTGEYRINLTFRKVRVPI